MRVIVAGAGVAGRRPVPHLVAGGRQVTATTSVAKLATCAGAKAPVRIPAWPTRPLAGGVAVTMTTGDRGFSTAKAKRALGWQLRYPSWRQGFAVGLT